MSTTARAALLAGTTLVLDQVAKAIVRATIERGESVDLILGIQLVNARNTGIAFGLLADGGVLLVVFAVLALAALLWFFARHRDQPLVWLPTGLLLGGAAGNLVDRVSEGAVVDFFDLSWFPAFNVADVAITFGVLALLYVLEAAPRRA